MSELTIFLILALIAVLAVVAIGFVARFLPETHSPPPTTSSRARGSKRKNRGPAGRDR